MGNGCGAFLCALSSLSPLFLLVLLFPTLALFSTLFPHWLSSPWSMCVPFFFIFFLTARETCACMPGESRCRSTHACCCWWRASSASPPLLLVFMFPSMDYTRLCGAA